MSGTDARVSQNHKSPFARAHLQLGHTGGQQVGWGSNWGRRAPAALRTVALRATNCLNQGGINYISAGLIHGLNWFKPEGGLN